MSRNLTILPGCFADRDSLAPPPMSTRARGLRLAAGLGFLALAALMVLKGEYGWPVQVAAAVPVWMGITHLVASVTGYQGCPELGAIPTLFLERPVRTNCTAWRLIDRASGADRPDAGLGCGCGRPPAQTSVRSARRSSGGRTTPRR